MNKIIDLLKTCAFYLINGYRKLLYALCCMFGINNNKIFVNCFDGNGVGDNPKYILEELLKLNNKIKVIWAYKKNAKYNSQIKYVKRFSLKAIYHQATSRVWIANVRNPYYSIKRKNQLYVQTWHGGMFFKKIENACADKLSYRYIKTARHDAKMIDYYISSSKDNTDYFLKYFWYSGGQIKEVGAPRNDILIKNNMSRVGELKKEFGVENKKVFVYAPTFRRDGSLSHYDLNLNLAIEELESKFGGNWVVFVRLHPRIAAKSKDFINYDDKIIDATHIADLQELLLITDFLITDYSSVIFDYVLSGKAAMVYASDIEEYRSDRNFHINLDDTPFDICINNFELQDAIRRFDYEKYIVDVKKFMADYGYADNTGDASEKIARIIDEFMSGKGRNTN